MSTLLFTSRARESLAQLERSPSDIKRLKAVRKALGVEPDPTDETLVRAIDKLKEENERLNKLKEASISQVSSHVEQILELKEENKKLARMVADQTLKVCQLSINSD